MIEKPNVCITVDAAKRESDDHTSADMRDRLRHSVAQLVVRYPELADFSHHRLQVSQSPTQHSGLGSGTQISCAAVASALLSQLPESEIHKQFKDCFPNIDASQLATLSGRGARSSIGLQGFLSGGLILDEGHCPQQKQNTREVKTQYAHLPDSWRVILLRPNEVSDLVSGQQETELMGVVAAKPNLNSHAMWELAKDTFAAAVSASFEDFSEKLENYLSYASKLFEPVQKGEFNGPRLTELANIARGNGLRAVGQSSWGPTLFGFCESLRAANELAASISDSAPFATTIEITKPAAQGARVSVEE